MAVFGAGEFAGFFADKRTGDNAGNIVRLDIFESNFAKPVKFVEAEKFLMRCNLDITVGGSVENRLAGFEVFFAVNLNNFGAAGGKVA